MYSSLFVYYYLMFDLTFIFSFLLILKTRSIILPNGIVLNLWQMKELYQMILQLSQHTY